MTAGSCGNLRSSQSIWRRAFPAHPLLPKQPERRAAARAWVEFRQLAPLRPNRALIHSFDQQSLCQAGGAIVDDLHVLEEQALAAQSDDRPYVLGAEFSLADVALYPWFEQIAVLERFRGFRFPTDCTRLIAWQRAVAGRDAVRATGRPPQFYLDGYERLLKQLAG